MNTEEHKQEIFNELKDKEYRDAYVKAFIDIGVPSQILALREERGLTQEELGNQANMKQESISRIEDPTRGTVNLKTLIRLASAFDLGLMVRFVSFSDLVRWKLNLSLEAMQATSFEDDSYFKEEPISENIRSSLSSLTEKPLFASSILSIAEHIPQGAQRYASRTTKEEKGYLHGASIR